MKDSLHTLLYAVVLGLVCATALTAVDRFTASRKQANAKAEEIRNILGVLGVRFDPDASSEELVKTFAENVRVGNFGKLTTYTYHPSGGDSNAQVVAIPFAGPGLWGPIKGFLSLEADMETIRGITFYEQEETPGLGGEIAAACLCSKLASSANCPAWFRHQFRGKRITNLAGQAGIHIVRRGTGTAINEVDAITGATMTSDKVEAMLNVVIRQIIKERNKHGR